MASMAEGAYARAGVDQALSGSAVSALVEVLAGIRTGRPSRAALASGHYANVLKIDERRGIALSCDSVGSKVIVCEQLGRYDTIGIDLFGMNANDVICVGADPIALLDYIAVEEADPEVLEQIGVGLREGAEQAGVEIPGGELAVLPDVVRGHPSPRGFDLVGFCVGLVDLDHVITGAAIEPGDALIGIPSSGVHSNGLSLARRVLSDLDERFGDADRRRTAARADRHLRTRHPRAARVCRRRFAASPTSPVRASSTCCGSRRRWATGSTIRCRSRSCSS